MSWSPLAALDDQQRRALEAYARLLVDFNRSINLISREDERHAFEHHVLHCLYLTYRRWPTGSVVVDWGTGGGLPAIPLAIAVPSVRFVAVDAVGKKVRAVRAIARRLGLANLDVVQARAEQFEAGAAYSVSRAAAPLATLWSWHRRLTATRASRRSMASSSGGDSSEYWKPGLVCLKGGDLRKEIAEMEDEAVVEELAIAEWTDDPYYADKVVLACAADPSGPPTSRRT